MKQTQIEVTTKNSGVTQATKVEITAIKDGKKPNPLVGFFKGVRDKIDGFKSAFKQEQGKDENIKTERALKQEGAKFSEKDVFMDQALWTLWLELLESLFGKKKFAVDNITKELHKNAKLTDEFKEVGVNEIQKRLGKNANLSKELITASLEKA